MKLTWDAPPDLLGASSFVLPLRDWVGTEADRLKVKRLYDFAGLDRRHWRIVGVDVGGRYSRSGALVWAVPRADGYVSAWRQIAQEGADSLRGHAFNLRDVSGVQLLQCFHTWGMSARHRALVELDLDLEDPA